MDQGVAAGKLSPEARERAVLAGVAVLAAAVGGADLVVEAAPENIALKCELFGQLDGLTPAHAILATNTSSLSVTEMAGATGRPAQVVGMHFFNPVHRMKLVEIVRALETSPETIEAASVVAMRMGKEPVVVREAPGFV